MTRRRIPTLPMAGRPKAPLPRKQCQGFTKGGSPCDSPFTYMDSWCPAHRPKKGTTIR